MLEIMKILLTLKFPYIQVNVVESGNENNQCGEK